ncbi:MAG: hypothetical protein AB7I79_20140 [Rhizobiaceae bacterium]
MRRALLVLAVAAAPQAVEAEQVAAAGNGASAGIERHFTTDVLDSPVARSDFYTRATGSFRYFGDIEVGRIGISGEVSASRHDTVRIEDDFAAGVTVEATRRVAEHLELRGALSATVGEEGDDLPLGPFAIGIRTRTVALAATLQAGYDIGQGTSISVETTASSERSGRTRFEDDVIGPIKLEPDRRRLKGGIRLAHVVGDTTAAVMASGRSTHVQEIGWPPVSLGFGEAGVATELVRTWANGARAALSLGMQAIAARDADYRHLRPVWHAELSGPVGEGLELRGALSAAFETTDTDDPLASYVMRGEVELGYRPWERLTLALGAYVEGRRNLLLENREDVAGGYGEAVYALSPAFSLVVRADYRQSKVTILEIRTRGLDTFLGIRARM